MFASADRQPEVKVVCVLMWREAEVAGCHLCFGAPTLVTPACAEAVPLAALGCVKNIICYTRCHLCSGGALACCTTSICRSWSATIKYHMLLRRTLQYLAGGSLLWHKR